MKKVPLSDPKPAKNCRTFTRVQAHLAAWHFRIKFLLWGGKWVEADSNLTPYALTQECTTLNVNIVSKSWHRCAIELSIGQWDNWSSPTWGAYSEVINLITKTMPLTGYHEFLHWAAIAEGITTCIIANASYTRGFVNKFTDCNQINSTHPCKEG